MKIAQDAAVDGSHRGNSILQYLKITKSRSGSYKLSGKRKLHFITKPPVYRKITYYFKQSPPKTPKGSTFNAENGIDSQFFTPPPFEEAITRSTNDPGLAGDFSRPCLLPIVKGKHPDMPAISPETMVGILNGKFNGYFLVVDCRYPYEYAGGHIIGAKNFYTKTEMATKLFSSMDLGSSSRPIIIFHCEFSSERGPSMYRFVRNRDRDMNAESYPSLYYPEMYILEGGYSEFYSRFKEYCNPQEYMTMRDVNHVVDMVNCRARCKRDKGTNLRKSFRNQIRARRLFSSSS